MLSFNFREGECAKRGSFSFFVRHAPGAEASAWEPIFIVQPSYLQDQTTLATTVCVLSVVSWTAANHDQRSFHVWARGAFSLIALSCFCFFLFVFLLCQQVNLGQHHVRFLYQTLE